MGPTSGDVVRSAVQLIAGARFVHFRADAHNLGGETENAGKPFIR